LVIGRLNLIPWSGFEPTVRIDICESAVLNHFATKAITGSGTRLWFHEVQSDFIAKWFITALSHS
jgi:hypothetical protein